MVRAHWNGAVIAESDDTDIIDAGASAPRRSIFDRFRRRGTGVGESTAVAGDAAMVTDLDDASFFAALRGSVTIVDFWAPWCGPCKQLHPLFDAQAAAHGGCRLRFAHVDVDGNPAIASTLGIMSIPTIVVFDSDGNEIEREIGLPGKRRLDRLVRDADSLAAEIAGQGAA